jgi:uncharacterized protein DUF2784
MAKLYLLFADLILITHTLFVLFILVGFALIWIGYFRRWNFVRNFYFRLAHLLAMGFVTVQTILGEDCPLTIWENQLRVQGGASPSYEQTFIGHWLGKILFFDVGLGTFAILYALFFLLIVGSFFWVKPQLPQRWRRAKRD